jgi:predicted nuclease of predicted toxin-antitoxin system
VAVKYLLDADLPRALFTGLRREDPKIDVVRVQQVGLREATDPKILAFAAIEERIVVTKDKATSGIAQGSGSRTAIGCQGFSSCVLRIFEAFLGLAP